MRALIVEEGLSRQALTGARALAAGGWQVGVAGRLDRSIAAYSRSVSWRHAVPAPQDDLAGWVAGLNEAIEEIGYEVVFGANDVDVLALSSRREDIRTVVPYPPDDLLRRALDKLELTKAAERSELAAPRTVPATEEELESAPEPVVVKSRLHATLESPTAQSRLEAKVAASRADAAAAAAEIVAAGGEPVLQEFVEGGLMAFVLIADRDGRLVAMSQQEADRVWPIDHGVSVRARTVPVDPALADRIRALVAELGWTGLAELQFVVGDDGPRLIDFNGRFYGSIALAVGAGANLPNLWATLATGRPLPEPVTATPGVRYQWLYGDLRRCMDERGRGVFGTLRYSLGAVHSVISARDPRPALRYVRLLISPLAKRFRR